MRIEAVGSKLLSCSDSEGRGGSREGSDGKLLNTRDVAF